MRGPLPPGSFVDYGVSSGWERCMTRGRRYRIVQPFEDVEHTMHHPGEEWYFVGSLYSHYDDALSIFVANEDRSEWLIPMRWDNVADNFKDYIIAVSGHFRDEYFATSRCPECATLLDRSRPSYCPGCHLVWDPA